jgi:excisionase family DNA binding protein
MSRAATTAPKKRLALTYEEAGEAIGVSLWTIKRMVEAGQLPVIMVGKRSPRIAVADLEKFLSTR